MYARQRDGLYGKVWNMHVEELGYADHMLKRVNEASYSQRHDTFLHEIKCPLEILLTYV